jgi:transcriptional regulator with XRE-family HTH domain
MNNQEKTLLETLAKRIQSRRHALKLSQEKLAERCGFDRTYISLLERAKRNPSFLNLHKLSIGLEIELSKLIEDI